MITKLNLTTSQPLHDKIEQVMMLEKITPKDIAGFTTPEREHLSTAISEMLKQLTGHERDSFLEKVGQVVPETVNSQLWENNHFVIGQTITQLINEYGSMPPKTLIAQKTGLSRQTVTKHLAGYKTQPDYQAEKEQFKYMVPKVLTSVFKAAHNGDIRAARLYFEMAGELNKQHRSAVVNEQNNYIQINNTILSQENLRNLSTEQLNEIERIVMDKRI